MTLRAALLAAVFLVSAVATAADWPQWRGPDRTGVSTETGLLKSWPTGGPPKVWTAKNLGAGFGTPSVADGKIFGMGTRDGKDGVWALKEADGSELWFAPIDSPRPVNQNNGPSSTPTYHAGKLYALSSNGKLACLDAASGKRLWEKSYTAEFGGRVQSWGYCESVLVDGDKVICAPGGEKSAVVALNPDTGSVIWKTEVPRVGPGYGYSSAVKTTVGGIPMYVTALGQTAGFVGVHADTGKLLWSYAAVSNDKGNIPTAIVRGDKVWCSTGYPPNGGSALLQLIPQGTDAVTVKELKVYKGRELQNHHGGIVLVGDYLYLGRDQNQGYPTCVDFRTGEIQWKEDRGAAGGSGSAAVSAADGMLYFRYQSGKMVLIRPNPERLEVVSSFDLPERSNQPSWPHPVVANGKLYIRDQEKLHCFNVTAGATN
jgi:outer membrane protein assembly factor BamB